MISAAIVGHDTLALHCAALLRDNGHAVAAVVTRHDGLRGWATRAGVPLVEPGPGLAGRLGAHGFDWLLSIANLDVLPPDVLALPRRGAVNFHDGPLPERAGLNAPVWAIIEGAAEHGITWHRMTTAVDAGDVLAERRFPVAPDDTALSLNLRCFAAAVESFPDLVARLEAGGAGVAQDPSRRRALHRGTDRPRAAAVLDLSRPAPDLARLVRALDHGDHPNPLARPKLLTAAGVLTVGAATVADGSGAPGAVLAAEPDALVVAAGGGALRLSDFRPLAGDAALPVAGDALPVLAPAQADALDAAAQAAARRESHWRARLMDLHPAVLPPLGGEPGGPLERRLPPGEAVLALAALALRLAGDPVDLALAVEAVPGATAPWVPLRVEGARVADLRAALARATDDARAQAPMVADLPHRLGGPAPAVPAVALSDGGPVPGALLTLAVRDGAATLLGDPARLSPAAFALWADRVEHLMGNLASPVADLPLAAPSEAAIVARANATDAPWEATTIPALVAAQAARTPRAPALTFADATLTFADLQARVDALAAALRARGAGLGGRVGLHLPRGLDLVAGALAIMAAGAAYVPLDPAYPAERTRLCLDDSEAALVLTDRARAAQLPPGTPTLLVDAPLPEGAPGPGPTPDDPAYLIYTSGSTGRPKGVVVTHRNVASFFGAMDAAIGTDAAAWLAVTSTSFDISVLELFWTLARGVHVVVGGEEDRRVAGGAGMAFSLFYWGNDEGAGRDKYRLLLDGARFADAHGFRAVWTPERHFHAFGGPYPNPSVTGAAVAAVTRHLDVRAGSCVAPLHHPARIAEEWAVVDNLCGGRAGLAIASGWMPEDFVLRPEAAPPRNKAAMVEAIGQLRRLWRGEAVEFPGANGPQMVTTQPRPMSPDLPLWITTAGNPDTWREAGRLGANVLTHLLGQSVAEVRDKITLYHASLREAGHDPARFTVTLMLHTFLAATREEAREVARGPMKAYLRSAAALIKQYAWAFPAFRRPESGRVEDLDLRTLSADEMDAILDFAFERYFEESGLFGTVDDALARVDELRAIGVGEVACLIDYGIAADRVMEGLRPLAEVVAQRGGADLSLAGQVARHGVTHLQCTPSMARMLIEQDGGREALGRLKHLLVGGEALPAALARELRALVPRVTNMYGPTETTIWSATAPVTGRERGTVGIGVPIANARFHVLDDAMAPVPIGVEGELWIGGPGVAQGYWRRPDLTAERFVADPFEPGGRLYRTGDLVRRAADGSLDFLGRADGQVKVRGFRIELGEIEGALEALPGVRQAVAVAREEGEGDVRLAAFVVADGAVDPGALDPAALRAGLAARLPAHMVPARIERVDAFPLTPNRKVDRNALAARKAAAPAVAPAPTAAPPSAPAAGPSLPRVAAIWSRLLGVAAVAPSQSFFDLGGHSLLAVQAHRAIRAELGADRLAVTDIFRFPTLGALARRVDELMGTSQASGAAPAPNEPPEGDNRADAMARRRAMRQARGA